MNLEAEVAMDQEKMDMYRPENAEREYPIFYWPMQAINYTKDDDIPMHAYLGVCS